MRQEQIFPEGLPEPVRRLIAGEFVRGLRDRLRADQTLDIRAVPRWSTTSYSNYHVERICVSFQRRISDHCRIVVDKVLYAISEKTEVAVMMMTQPDVWGNTQRISY